MSNKAVLRGALASAAGLILLVAPDAFASQEREKARPTQTNRGAETSGTRTSAPPSRSSTSGGAARIDRNGPRGGVSRDNPRTTRRAPQESSTHRGQRRVDTRPRTSGNSGARRGHGNHHGSRGHHYSSHYNYSYPRSPFYWYGFYYPFYYGHHSYGYPYSGHYDRYRRSSSEVLGALDLDVKPEKAEVYIDGRFVGVADNFDGFPSYLWLTPGTYQIAFYKEGFATITREVAVLQDAVVDFNDRLESGAAIKPEAPPEQPQQETRTAATRDSDWEAKAEEWRGRAKEYMARKREVDPSGTLDARGQPGRLFLVVRPGDASVYLDGRFLGTGDELSRLHSGLMVDPGDHEIEVVRPGFGSEAKSFSVEAGEEVDLSLRLRGVEGAV